MNKRYLLLFITVFISCLCLSSCGALSVQQTIQSITSMKDGSEKKPVSRTIKVSGSIKKDDWEKLDNALRSKKNIRIYLDLSKCTPGSEDGDAEIPNSLFTLLPSLTGFVFPEGITSIGYNAFTACPNLKSVYFPHSTMHCIGHYCFSECKSLTDVHLYSYDGKLTDCFTKCGTLKLLEVPDKPLCAQFEYGPYETTFSETKISEIRTPTKKISFDEWISLCSKMTPQNVSITNAVASSNASQKYNATNLYDSTSASWIEGKSDDGIGESVVLTFEKPTTVEYIEVKNGFGNLAYFYSNNRVKDCEVVLDDDESTRTKVTLDDTPVVQNVLLEKYDRLYSKLKLTILSTYKGSSSGNDTCLEEISVNGKIGRTVKDADGNEIKSYIYDSETNKLFKELFTLDVGSDNIRILPNGLLQVQSTFWETGEKEWSTIDYSFEGHLYSNFWPGTGGGGEENDYKIFLFPTGRHILFIWHYIHGDSYSAEPHADLSCYVWQNGNWVVAPKDEPTLKEINALRTLIAARGLSYDFTTSYNQDVILSACAISGRQIISVPFSFSYDGKTFLPYEQTAITAIALGTPEQMTSSSDWKEELAKNPLAVAAAFNRSKEAVQFLIDSGCDVNKGYDVSDYESDDSDTASLKPLEACDAGKNTQEIKDVLLKAGASYSPKILLAAFMSGNIARVKEYATLVKDSSLTLSAIFQYFSEHNESAESLAYITASLKAIKQNGCDINGFNSKNSLNSPVTQAIRYYSPSLLKAVVDGGCAIPTGSSLIDATECYLNADEGSDSAQKEVLEYIIQSGVNLNGVDKDGNSILHFLARNCFDDRAISLAKRLFALGCNTVNLKNNDGDTALQKIINNNEEYTDYEYDYIVLLLSHGADMTIRDSYGQTVLQNYIANVYNGGHDSTESQKQKLVTLLLKNCNDINQQDSDHLTAMHTLLDSSASSKEKEELCKLLHSYGATVTKAELEEADFSKEAISEILK